MRRLSYAEKVAAITTMEEVEQFELAQQLCPGAFFPEDRALLREKRLRIEKEVLRGKR